MEHPETPWALKSGSNELYGDLQAEAPQSYQSVMQQHFTIRNQKDEFVADIIVFAGPKGKAVAEFIVYACNNQEWILEKKA